MVLEHVGQRGDQPGVELDRDHVGATRIERQREGAEAGPDLDNPIPGADTGIPDDRPRDVRVQEEVLSERPARSDPVPVRQGT